MSSNELRRNVGRLVEIRAHAYRTPNDVDDMIAMIRSEIGKFAADEQAIICADWRGIKIFAPAVADKARVMLSTFNPRVKKSVLVLSNDAPTALLQVSRLVRESAHPGRKLVTSAPDAIEFLRDTLTAEELDRAKSFLGA